MKETGDNMKPWDAGQLRVVNNGSNFINGEKPFFWLGDTAWLLFSHLSEEDAYIYLRNRKEKGFNVIQATLIHEWPQTNIDGSNALIDDDYTKPDMEGGFWQRVVRIVKMAEQLGLYMAILPAWGGHVKSGRLNEKNVDAYIDFVISLLADMPNIIWLVGGDVRGDAAYDTFCRIGRKLKKEGKGHLVGFHPFGRTSSTWYFKNEDWLDFNMFQSGHRRYDQVNMSAWDDNDDKEPIYGEDNWRYVKHDLKVAPNMPTIDGEPSYEQILQGLHDINQPYWQSYDIRRYAYWACFQGAAGHTYGSNAIMQFYVPGEKTGAFGCRRSWQREMNNIGASCMKHLKDLFESVDFIHGKAMDEELLVGTQRERYERVSVFAGKDYVLCYTYTGFEFDLNLSSYGDKLTCEWMDPLTGVYSYVGEVQCEDSVHFIPPEKLEGHNDWVLVLR